MRNSCALANPQSFAINGRCILPTDKEMNFFQSRYTCSTYGGDLLTYLTAEDTALLAQALQNPSNTSVQYYIGLTKWAWKWQTGELWMKKSPLIYMNGMLGMYL